MAIHETGEGLQINSFFRSMRRADPADVGDAMASAAASFGASDLVLYLADFEQQVLEPLPDRSTHEELPHSEEVATTLAGRVFLQSESASADRADGTRVWVPIVEGSDTTGVLALTLPHLSEKLLAACEELGALAGLQLAVQTRVTDLYGLHRRRKAMSLAASMQWDLLPPLTLSSRRVVVAGMLEPAYEVGGDCFDYALNGSQFDFAFMDSMGHGLRSAMVAALAIGCYRHDRRESRTLDAMHRNIDGVIGQEFGGDCFVTGQLGRLDLSTGSVQWVNAGHPTPLLVRHGRVVGSLEGPPTVPWGVGPHDFQVYTEQLEPGDSLLFYTDGVVGARGESGGDFGSGRLADLVGKYASDGIPLALIVRNIVRAVVAHHGGNLQDDATVLMVNWPGPAAGSGVLHDGEN